MKTIVASTFLFLVFNFSEYLSAQNQIDAYFLDAVKLSIDNGKLKQAEEILDFYFVQKNGKSNGEAYCLKAKIQALEGNYLEAQKSINKAIDKGETTQAFYLNYLLTLKQDVKFNPAINKIENIERLEKIMTDWEQKETISQEYAALRQTTTNYQNIKKNLNIVNENPENYDVDKVTKESVSYHEQVKQNFSLNQKYFANYNTKNCKTPEAYPLILAGQEEQSAGDCYNAMVTFSFIMLKMDETENLDLLAKVALIYSDWEIVELDKLTLWKAMEITEKKDVRNILILNNQLKNYLADVEIDYEKYEVRNLVLPLLIWKKWTEIEEKNKFNSQEYEDAKQIVTNYIEISKELLQIQEEVKKGKKIKLEVLEKLKKEEEKIRYFEQYASACTSDQKPQWLNSEKEKAKKKLPQYENKFINENK